MIRVSGIPYTQCFETLSNDLRMGIITSLQEKPQSVLDLTKKLGVEQSRLSHALQVLRECNYVTVETKGKQRIYHLQPKAFHAGGDNVFDAIEKHVHEHCGSACKRLGTPIKHTESTSSPHAKK